MSCVSNTSCLGGSLFCSGLLVDLNRTGDSLYQGGEFFTEIQRVVRRTTAMGKRVDTYGSYPLNSCFPLLLSLAQTRDQRPETALKKGKAEDLFYRRGAQRAPISLPIRSVRYFTATHAVKSTQARHTRVARIVYGCWWMGPIR